MKYSRLLQILLQISGVSGVRLPEALVPCGFCSAVTSSHVNVSEHNLTVVYGAYEGLRGQHPILMNIISLQLDTVEVWLYIEVFNILIGKAGA
jgi:hypothetical protein